MIKPVFQDFKRGSYRFLFNSEREAEKWLDSILIDVVDVDLVEYKTGFVLISIIPSVWAGRVET